MASHVVEWALEHNYMDSDEWAWAQPQGEDGGEGQIDYWVRAGPGRSLRSNNYFSHEITRWRAGVLTRAAPSGRARGPRRAGPS